MSNPKKRPLEINNDQEETNPKKNINEEEIQKNIIKNKIDKHFPQATLESLKKTSGTVWLATLTNKYCWMINGDHDQPSSFLTITSNGIQTKCQDPNCSTLLPPRRINCFTDEEKQTIFNIKHESEDVIVRQTLEEYDKKYAHVLVGDTSGSLFIVLKNLKDPVTGGKKTKFVTENNFIKMRQNDVTSDGRKKVDIWLKHPSHKIYDEVVFLPGEDVEDEGWFNMWSGFSVKPLEHFFCENYENDPDLSQGLNFIKSIICSGDEETYDFVINWIAETVQRPTEPIEVVLGLRGARGIGKSFFCSMIGYLFGSNYQSIHAKELTDDFNSHLNNTILLVAEEALGSKDRKVMSYLQHLITAAIININIKNITKYRIKNCSHIILTSNFNHMIGVDVDERRYCIIDVCDEKANDREYFSAVQNSLTKVFYRKFLTMLMNRDVSGWKRTKWPERSLMPLWENKLETLGYVERWFYDYLKNSDEKKWKTDVTHGSIERSMMKFYCCQKVTKFKSRVEKSLNFILSPHNIHSLKTVYSSGKKCQTFNLPEFQVSRRKFEEFVKTPGSILWGGE